METPHVTPTGIAIALAVAVALGLLFFGPRVFAPFTTSESSMATSTTATTTTTVTSTTTMDTPTTSSPIPSPLPTELTITDEIIGTGAVATAGSQVTVQYVGMLPDGTVFDASRNHGDQGFSFNLGAGQVIKGWDQGIVGMKEGGKRQLIIPAALAYGNQAVGGVIPANATLVFEVELLKVQ